ncbi:efflux RND transporter periplasmic adaptor subunit [Tistlia consotensis]|uniref:efflux RND transporter periplasmic adaptor subunit n=1 Tax=Tistlia consotensis TaxID=1321365 RepID=UPI001F3A860F|nr:efflux RND transporter periplasmic adaptor subunit [Tistlia consotensis]
MTQDSSPTRPRRRWPRRLLLALLVVAGLGAAGFAVQRTLGSDKPAQAPATAPVLVQDIEETVLANGELEAKKLVNVGAQVSGQIKSLKVELGDEVEKGQLIAEIDPLTRQNALRDAEAELTNIKAQKAVKQATLKQAQLAFQRQARMLKGDATSRADYEDAEATLDTTKAEIQALDAQIAQAEIAADTARINLGYTEITAPIKGTVVYLPVKEGQTVNAAQTTPTIAMLADLDTMTVSAEVSEADVTRVRPGQTVYFSILGEPDKRYYSILRSIEPAPESISEEASTSTSSSSSSSSSDSAVYYDALFDIENPEHRLRISMTAQVSIVIDQAHKVPTIPSSALGRPGKDGLYAVRVLRPDGTLKTRQVEIGINNSVRAEVRSGLSEGDKVVLNEAPAAPATSSSSRRPRGFLGF